MSTPVDRERPCQVCQHPDRDSIEQAIVNQRSARELARQFTIGSRRGQPDFIADHKIVTRHRDKCMGEAYQLARAGREEASGKAMLDRLQELDRIMDESIARLRKGTVVMHDGVPLLNPDGTPVTRYDDSRLAQAVREARANLELRTKLAGQNPEGDPDAADDARELLGSPEARKAITELERMLADGPVQGNG